MSTKTYQANLTKTCCLDVQQHAIGDGSWKVDLQYNDVGLRIRLYYNGDLQKWSYASYKIKPPHAMGTDFYGLRLDGLLPSKDLEVQLTIPIPPAVLYFLSSMEKANPALSVTIIEHYPPEDGQFDFENPGKLTDAVLVVEAKNIHVNKSYLAIHSKYFETLFFGEFAETKSSVFELKDLDYSQFMEFLRVIHPMRKMLTRETVETVLAMADALESSSTRVEVTQFLYNDETFTDFEKIVLADRYSLSDLEYFLLTKLRTQQDILTVIKLGCCKLSERLKAKLVKKLGPML